MKVIIMPKRSRLRKVSNPAAKGFFIEVEGIAGVAGYTESLKKAVKVAEKEAAEHPDLFVSISKHVKVVY